VSRYRIEYAPAAEVSRKAMPGPLRARFDAAMNGLAADPYGHGSTAVKGEQDRREATVAGVAIRYYVSQTILTVTVVRAVFY
jgi:hypothetical protein